MAWTMETSSWAMYDHGDSRPTIPTLDPETQKQIAELRSLKLSEGLPDDQRFEKVYSDMLGGMTHWQRRELRQMLLNPPFGPTSLSDLPSDTVGLIMRDLDPRSVVACRRVSKAWLRALTREEVVRDVLHAWCPGLVETAARLGWQMTPDALLKQELVIQRHHDVGKFNFYRRVRLELAPEPDNDEGPGSDDDGSGTDDEESGTIFTPCPIAHPSGEFPVLSHPQPGPNDPPNVSDEEPAGDLMLYCAGRVAWRVDGCCFALDDLRTDKRRLVSMPYARTQHVQLDVLKLTDQMLVMLERSMNFLVMYFIESDVYTYLKMPYPMIKCWAEGAVVVLYFGPRHGFCYWALGDQKSTRLFADFNTNREPHEHDDTGHFHDFLIDVIFHPGDAFSFSIVKYEFNTSVMHPPKAVCLSVNEFKKGKRIYSKVHKQNVYISGHTRPDCPGLLGRCCGGDAAATTLTFAGRRMDNHGGHAFVFIDWHCSILVVSEYNCLARRFRVTRVDGPDVATPIRTVDAKMWLGSSRTLDHGGRRDEIVPFIWGRKMHHQFGYLDGHGNPRGNIAETEVHKMDIDERRWDIKHHWDFSLGFQFMDGAYQDWDESNYRKNRNIVRWDGKKRCLDGDNQLMVLGESKFYHVWSFGDFEETLRRPHETGDFDSGWNSQHDFMHYLDDERTVRAHHARWCAYWSCMNAQNDGEAQGSSPLVAEFLSIRLPDGRPDTDSRMRALDTLLTVLTPWERWHLRARMNEVATGLALLPSLPGEIIALIGYHLDLRDIYACRAVSTAWRDIWKREDVARDLLRNLYPGLFECSMAKVQHESAVHLLDRTNRMVLRRKNSRFVARLTEPDCYNPHSEITEQHDQTGFMFHPTNPKLFSIATLNMVRSGPESDVKFSDDLFHQDPDGITYSFRLHVSDYNDRTLVSTKTHTLDNVPRYFSPLRWQLYRESDPYALLPPAQNFHQPIDAHGGHAFFAADPTVGHMVLVEYNVVTRRLTVPLCSSTPPLFRSIWWGQGRNAHAGRNPFLWNRMFYMHAKRADVRNHGMGEDLEFLLRVLDLECATEEGKGHSRLSFPSEHIFAGGDSSLHGDDRYLVLSHHPSDSQYTVWDFGDADAEEEGGKEVTMKGWLTREEVTKMLSVEGAVDKGSLD
ncbi:hypothetical protein ACHAQA_003735 [Verticillium albo-atrum]